MDEAVTDPALLSQLNGPDGSVPDPSAPPVEEPVDDPTLIAQLNGDGAPVPDPVHAESSMDKLKGLGEMARGAVQNSGADVLAGWSGIQQMVTNALGITSKPAADVVEEQRNALSYTPKNKAPAIVEKAAQIIGTNVEKMRSTLGDWSMDETNSPMLASLAYTMPDALMSIIGARIPGEAAQAATRGAVKIAERAANMEGKDQAMRAATRVGYALPPSISGGVVGRTIEGISGPKLIGEDAARTATETTNRLARVDMQMPYDKVLNETAFSADRFAKAEPYRQALTLPRIMADQDFYTDIANAGKRFQAIERDFPEAVSPEIHKERGIYSQPSFEPSSVLQNMTNLREDAALMLRSQSVADRHIGAVKRDISEAFEKILERHAKLNGKPDFAAQFAAARKAIAKNHMYEDSTNTTTGNVNGLKVMAARDMGKYLDGEAETIANTAKAFPQIFKDIDKKGHSGPFSMIDYFIAIGTAMHAVDTGSLGATALAGGALARPAARKMVLSGPYQKAFAKPRSHTQGVLGQVTGALGDTPEAAGLGAIAGAETGDGQE